MGSRYAVGVTISSAHDLKNVNRRYGDLKPYAVVWVDGAAKCSTKVALNGDTNPVWDDEKLTIPLPPDRRLGDLTLHLDLVHARSAGQDQTKPLIGSAELPLIDVTNEVGIGGKLTRSLKLKRRSGRFQGRLDVKVVIKDPARYNHDHYAPTYGQPARAQSRYYGAILPQYGYGKPYVAAAAAAAAHAGYPYRAPHAPLAYGQGYEQSSYAPLAYGQGYEQSSYGESAPHAPLAYGQGYEQSSEQSSYGESAPHAPLAYGQGYEQSSYGESAPHAPLAYGQGYEQSSYGESAYRIEDNAADRVEDDSAYEDDEDGGYDDF